MTSVFDKQETQNLFHVANGAKRASEDMALYSPHYFTTTDTKTPRSRAALDKWIAFTHNHKDIHNHITRLLGDLHPALGKILRASARIYETTPPGLETALQNGIRNCNRALDLERDVQQAIDQWWAAMKPAQQVHYQEECDRSVPRKSRSGSAGGDDGDTSSMGGSADIA